MAALKSVEIAGVVRARIKLMSTGELDNPYKLLNYRSATSSWVVIGDWNNTATGHHPLNHHLYEVTTDAHLLTGWQLLADWSKLRTASGNSVVYPDSTKLPIGLLVNEKALPQLKLALALTRLIGWSGRHGVPNAPSRLNCSQRAQRCGRVPSATGKLHIVTVWPVCRYELVGIESVVGFGKCICQTEWIWKGQKCRALHPPALTSHLSPHPQVHWMPQGWDR
jgi:hypothetical protein